MKNVIVAMLALGFMVAPAGAAAHCPLCTAGAAAAGGIAAWLGVSSIVIGIFLGAAALSMGWWLARNIRRSFIPLQTQIIAGGIFASTIIPLLPLFQEYTSWYVAFAGEYGTLLHNVYLLNLFLLGSIAGAFIVLVSPEVSKRVTALRRGKAMPYQGLAITFFLLLVASLVAELAL
ncbi:MAG TPA: hypothetical protein DIS53_02235 [Candidatus Wildermuthbacteria bacterium]|uniref:Uncharacterized protein n=1 Tax=Candidatus Yanofskybacteria bacterium GW2011_GWC1_48_11 TaxID=1619027 RepID=A0A837INN9_9BACT|nr:MAG: hypothetical protein UY25_C0004G0116 [Candidatus Yanofskybacteria bacterium GW2011_GWC1_48_11]KKW04451.1 MAG: hypothetical protein UY38_C0001G0018 [Parcubacteria group bacterium GW2011_GWB1_49_12]KKW08619.1 MAG: hypothetical protein UY45_C0005G0022 [Parcubacteria group bacterium GW2011_GWA1_49_26]KKW13676.1 MAG: hypothetical protein UY53_C0009G0012 [Parcubacteria group bacterium GW2011_GWA2_50_10]OHA61596.1 MAG: hypothetical protein A2109_03655 [Candidatus Wildermuthbacteria bacterium G